DSVKIFKECYMKNRAGIFSTYRFGLVLTAVVLIAAAAAYANPADGTYQGSAEGYKSEIVVEVTVSDGQISAIEVVSHDETVALAEPVMESTIEAIIEAQSTDIDARTRATVSSKAVLEAVQNALAEAN
ncbi:MAG: FMN-binding protein, partial [Spirochaetaceae bacterium]